MKSSFTARRVQPWNVKRGRKPEAGKNVVDLVDVAVDEDVLPRDEHLVEDEDRVVLVQPAGQRVVERAAHHRGRASAYDGRQISFTPGASIGTVKTSANSFVLIGEARSGR